MAAQLNTTEFTLDEPIARLSDASLHSCYLDTLLCVLEDVFEDIPQRFELVRGGAAADYACTKSKIGLNIVYMAHDQLGSLKTKLAVSETQLRGLRGAVERRA